MEARMDDPELFEVEHAGRDVRDLSMPPNLCIRLAGLPRSSSVVSSIVSSVVEATLLRRLSGRENLKVELGGKNFLRSLVGETPKLL